MRQQTLPRCGPSAGGPADCRGYFYRRTKKGSRDGRGGVPQIPMPRGPGTTRHVNVGLSVGFTAENRKPHRCYPPVFRHFPMSAVKTLPARLVEESFPGQIPMHCERGTTRHENAAGRRCVCGMTAPLSTNSLCPLPSLPALCGENQRWRSGRPARSGGAASQKRLFLPF